MNINLANFNMGCIKFLPACEGIGSLKMFVRGEGGGKWGAPTLVPIEILIVQGRGMLL